MQDRPQHGHGFPDAAYVDPRAHQPAGPPAHQQFQFAAGYVVPGAGEGQSAPMAAHGGTIGIPVAPGQQPAPMHGLSMPAGFAHPARAAAAATLPSDQSSAWAYPTPNGLQLVQSGPGTHMVAPPAVAAAAAPRMRRRIRWEVIVPMAAVLCLIAAVALFIHDFDRFTGRDASTAAEAGTAQEPASDPAPADAAEAEAERAGAALAEARLLMRSGRYADAKAALAPLLVAGKVDPRASRLRRQVDAAAARQGALLQRLALEQRERRWSAVLRTIDQVEAMRPLPARLVRLRTSARAKVKAAATRRAAAARDAQRANAAPANLGGGSGVGQPPRAGGAPSSQTSARPPANVGAGELPPRPDVAAPSGPQGGGAAAVAGAQADCRPVVHDGQTMCM
jgi:hypothetical protein